MFKSVCALALMLPAAVVAAPVGPIGYTKLAGTTHELYLVQRNGSNPVRIHRTAAKTGIGFFDIKPGGGQVAFGHSKGGMYIISYNADGVASPPGPAIDPGCFVEGMDWSADGSSILYSRSCGGNGEVRVYNVIEGTSAPLFAASLTSVRWGPGNSVFYFKPAASGRTLMWRQMGPAGCEATLFESPAGFSTFDVARQGGAAIVGDSQARIWRVPLPAALPSDCALTLPVATKVGDGTEVHFSPDDTEFLYKTPHMAKGVYLRVQKTFGYDTITPKGDYVRTDWDPLAPAAPAATDFGIRSTR